MTCSSRAPRAGGSGSAPRSSNGAGRSGARQLGDVALLAVQQLGQQAQRRLVGAAGRGCRGGSRMARDQRGLELAVGDPEVGARRGRAALAAVEQRGELLAGRARVVARRAQLVQAALDLGHRARVVVQVVAERVLALQAAARAAASRSSGARARAGRGSSSRSGSRSRRRRSRASAAHGSWPSQHLLSSRPRRAAGACGARPRWAAVRRPRAR